MEYGHNTSAPQNNSVMDSATGNATSMQKYFGPLRNSDIDTFASDAFAHETHNLPRAYVGRNKFLMATIDFLITKDDDWYTRYVLPWLYTEELHVKWNIWRFNRTMMDYEPEQGVPRYVSYESESRSDSLVRRGLAFIIEHGFYKTELGRQHYLMNLKQIVEAVHETVYFGVMHELLASPNFYQQWEAKHGRRNSILTNDAVSAMAEERWRFACVQKDIKGLFILDAEIKDRMRRVGIEPDSWIFPSKMAIYASMVPEYFNEYIRGGDKAASALEIGAKRFDTFRGSRVFETRPFDTDFMASGSIEPLMRDREIGEYYELAPCYHTQDSFDEAWRSMQQLDPAGLDPGQDQITAAGRLAGIRRGTSDRALQTDLRTAGQNIRIFDMSQDKFDTITYREAITNAWRGEDNGVIQLLAPGPNKNFEVTLGALRRHGMTDDDVDDYVRSFAPPTGMLDVGGDDIGPLTPNSTVVSLMPPDEPGTQCFFNLAVNLFQQNARGGPKLIIPHKLFLFRPRMSYRMGTAILLKGGVELGQTLHGHHDFQLTDDVIHKTHIGHYTFYSKSVVREPKNMYLAEDVYCAGYNGGENNQFVKEDQAERSFATRVDHRTASIICVPVPPDTKGPACMSITGSFDQHGIDMASNNNGNYATMAVVANKVEPFMNSSIDSRGLGENDNDTINGICFRGATQTQASPGAPWVETQHNLGHWGPSVYDGCASVRQGLYAHLRAPGSTVSVGY